jgi:hypothetical protein
MEDPPNRNVHFIIMIALNMYLGDVKIENKYNGIAWRTYFTKINLSGGLRDQKVQLPNFFSILYISSSQETL